MSIKTPTDTSAPATLTMGWEHPLHSSKVATHDYTLQVVEGPHRGAVASLDQEIAHIGRADWCDLPLPKDQWVSNIHAELFLTPEGVLLQDNNSRNGIFLGPQQIFKARLQPGARFRVGESIIELHSQQTQKEIRINYFDESGILVGRSERMRQIFTLLSRLAKRASTILFTGETGTGKSSIARAFHQQSPRKDGPFVVVNCGALPKGLIESELFGHEKGAFTSAAQQHIGFFEQAHGGTIFLDEIGELPLDLQPKLLDVLERRCIRRLGGQQEIQLDFFLIAATHLKLSEATEQGLFRKDLYYRLSVVDLEIPPLRSRPEDIPLLIQRFLQDLSPQSPIQLTEAAIRALQQYLWPGNVRQLRNVLERSAAFAQSNILDVEDLHLPSPISTFHNSPLADLPIPPDYTTQPCNIKDILEDTERYLLEQVLLALDWNVQATAQHLNISRGWLHNRIKKYGLQRP